MTQFQVGQTYSTRSACDHECIFSYTVVSRTAKRLVLEDRHGRISKRGVYTYSDGIEHCKPQGSYSMAPVISADEARS